MLQVSSDLSVREARRSISNDSEGDGARGQQLSRIASWLSLHRWQGRLFWIVVLFGPIWLLDEPLATLRLNEKKTLLLGDIRDVTRQFGEPMGIAWISVVLWFVDRSRRRPLVVAIVATLIASSLGSGAKLLVGRERPKVSEGKTILTGPHWPGTMDPDPSFPSGHSITAFGFAFGLCRLYPQHRKLWVSLAAGCGLSRAFGEAHFLTDVLVGAWLGWDMARLCWESRFGAWLASRMDRRIPDAGWFPRWSWNFAGPSLRMAAAVAQGEA